MLRGAETTGWASDASCRSIGERGETPFQVGQDASGCEIVRGVEIKSTGRPGHQRYLDEVRVRSGEVVNTAASLRIPFDLPDGLGCGVLSFTAGTEPGVLDAGLSLTAQRRAEWRVLFPLLEKLSADGISQDELEFFFPMQEGWIGGGEYDLSVAYGHRAWLPVLAAWNPAGTGIAIQSRDATFTFRSLRIRNASAGKAVPTYRPDPLDMASAFPMDPRGLSLSVCPIGFKLEQGQTWRSATAAIHVYDGRQLFKRR